MTHAEKLEIAGLLDEMGVDIIEAGFPIASEGDFQAVSEIAKRSKNAVICGLSRANFKDIDRCWEAVQHAGQPRIHTFIGTSPLHRAIPNLTRDEMAERIHDTVTHARNLCDNVQWSPMDATRTEWDYLARVVEIAIKAVFDSWMGKRAVDYRREFNITKEMANGTAVNVVTMVFGNLGDDCATGVGFTRYPDSGENKLFGEYLVNAQGEDVVAGIRTPKPIDALQQEMPEMYRQLQELRDRLESHYREVQDFEFTIERGRLYCLQTRNGKMNAIALVRTSVEMANAGLLDRNQALLRIDPAMLEQLLFPRLDPNRHAVPVARGLPASPGAATGHAVLDADRAEQLGRGGQKVILVREETKPEDIHGFFASQGILTARGGKTSHAAVVARGMGKPCVAGAEGIHVDTAMRKAFVGEHSISEGDLITIDGTTGDQRFFLGWAQVWRRNYRDEELKRRLKTDSHSPSIQRVWVIRNMDAWYEAFNVTEGDAMYLAPEDRVKVW